MLYWKARNRGHWRKSLHLQPQAPSQSVSITEQASMNHHIPRATRQLFPEGTAQIGRC